MQGGEGKVSQGPWLPTLRLPLSPADHRLPVMMGAGLWWAADAGTKWKTDTATFTAEGVGDISGLWPRMD